MNRFLEALIDLYVLPESSIIMYDEFENGLDPLIIEDLVELYKEKLMDNQYIFTSHHPYVIQNISPKNWIVLSRNQYKVQNTPGIEVEKDGELGSTFISLINDDRYTGE